MENGEIKIVVVDDHPVVLEGLTSGLGQFPYINIVGTAFDVAGARLRIEQGGFDLLVTDLNMPEVQDGLDIIRYACHKLPDCKIVVLTYSNRPDDIYQANRAGAHAYLVKDCNLDEIAESFHVVMAGGRPPLSPDLEAALWCKLQESTPGELPHALNDREWEVLRLMTSGATNDEIAAKLFLSPRVVRRCNTSIYGKLGVRNRAEAIALVMREELFG